MKPVTLYPSDNGAFISGIPSVAITVNTGEAERLLAYSPPSFTTEKGDYDGDPIDLSGSIAARLGDETPAPLVEHPAEPDPKE